METARTTDYTVPELVDFTGARYELLDGEAEIGPGVHVIPTPGHVDGHQSVVLECEDGSIVLADALAARASEIGYDPPLPTANPWVVRLLEFDPRRVVFAHDAAVWVA